MPAIIEAHAAGCTTCRKVLSTLARELATPTATTVPERPSRPASETAAGGGNAIASRDSLPASSAAEGRRGSIAEHVDRYVVTRVLGAGGMGVVYAAVDPELDRTVAVKLLRDAVLDDQMRRELEDRLRREARAMAKLSHPNVPFPDI